MRYLSLPEIFELHVAIISKTGGSRGLRDIGALEAAVNQPRLTFNQKDLYDNIISKAAALCYSLIMNHPFVDGNKRVGHAAMEIFFMLNGYEIDAKVQEQEKIILDLAVGKMSREEFTAWLKNHVLHISTA
jgi:death-on-curing protein